MSALYWNPITDIKCVNFIKFLQAEPSNEDGNEESGADVSTPDVIITLTLAKRSFEDGKGLSVKVYNNGVIKVNGDLNKIQTRLKKWSMVILEV